MRYGLAVTTERLRQVEVGEAFVRSLGVSGDLRVRHLGAGASIEVVPGELPLLRRRWDEVISAFAELGFERVELDPSGYRRGRLLEIAAASSADPV